MIELRHLRYFVAVAEELNFTRAAERLHTAQPSLSQQIRHLEDYLGTALLMRSNRRVALTLAGQRFLAEARLALQQTEKAVAMVRVAGEPDRLRIGLDPGLAIDFFPRLLPRIREAMPDLACDIRSLPPGELQQALRDEAVDVLFTGFAGGSPDIVSEKLFRDSLIAVLPGSHARLRGQGPMSLSALQGLPVIVGASAICPHLRRALSDRCAELGVELTIAHEVNNLFEALALVLSGRGICLCSASLAALIPVTLSLRRLDASAPQLDIMAAHRAGSMSKRLRKVVQIAREVGADLATAAEPMIGAA